MGRPAYFRARAGFQVLVWCLMSNHYHLALRMGGLTDLRSGQRSPAVVEAREAVAWVAVVLNAFQLKEVAGASRSTSRRRAGWWVEWRHGGSRTRA